MPRVSVGLNPACQHRSRTTLPVRVQIEHVRRSEAANSTRTMDSTQLSLGSRKKLLQMRVWLTSVPGEKTLRAAALAPRVNPLDHGEFSSWVLHHLGGDDAGDTR